MNFCHFTSVSVNDDKVKYINIVGHFISQYYRMIRSVGLNLVNNVRILITKMTLRYNQKLWIDKNQENGVSLGYHTPTTAKGRRKDTPCTRLPQMKAKHKFRKSPSHWMNWPVKDPDA